MGPHEISSTSREPSHSLREPSHSLREPSHSLREPSHSLREPSSLPVGGDVQNLPPPREGGNPFVLKGNSADAGRNLVLGVIAVLALIPIGGVAFWWAPQESFVAVATALLVGLLMFLALQFRLLLQRNGVFLLLSGGLALALLVPIGVRLMATGSEWAQTVSEFKRYQLSRGSSESNGGRFSELKGGVPQAPVQFAKGDAGVAPAKTEGSPNSKSAAAGTGENSSFADLKESKESPLIKSPSEASAVKESFPEDPAARAIRATQLAKDEAIRRYPELQIVGTRHHTAYLDAYNALVRSRKDEFFKDPQWPLKIAEILAASEGWARLDERSASPVPPPRKGPMPGAELDLNAPAGPARQAEKAQEKSPVKDVEPEEDAFAQAVKAAQKEVIRRYPAVGVEGSSENKAYQACFVDLNSRNTDFFERPDWPLRLADLVAKQEDWKRPEGGGGAEKNGAAKISESKETTLPQ